MDAAQREALLHRGLDDIFDPSLRASIGRIIDDVREHGDDAVCRALATFDGIELRPDQLQVTADEIAGATVSAEVDAAIDDAITHLRAFNERLVQRAADWSFESEPGLMVGEKVTPIASVGLFVPSGKASYPSVAYQLGVPAVVAGVRQIALVVPPVPGGAGEVDPAVLTVCRKLGIGQVFRANGPAGIAALGFGTQSFPRVRKIVGPGSPAVTCAQVEMQRHGVATMMLLGPTESVVVADHTADPMRLAADLLIEAEHGTDSAVVLITTSSSLADAVDAELDRATGRPAGSARRGGAGVVGRERWLRAGRRPGRGGDGLERLRPRTPAAGGRRGSSATPRWRCSPTPARSWSASTPRSAPRTSSSAARRRCRPAASPTCRRASPPRRS